MGTLEKGSTLTEQVTNDNPGELEFFFFSYKLENSGIVQSKLGELGTRDKINRELAGIYGPEGVSIVEMRKATEDEIAEYKAALEKQFGLTAEDVDQISQMPDETKTIN